MDSFSLNIVVKSLDSHTCKKVEPAKEEPVKEGEEAVGLCVIVIFFPFSPYTGIGSHLTELDLNVPENALLCSILVAPLVVKGDGEHLQAKPAAEGEAKEGEEAPKPEGEAAPAEGEAAPAAPAEEEAAPAEES